MTHNSPTIATTLLLLLAGTDLRAQEPAPAEAVAPLTWGELFARPELWPRHCRAQPGLRFEGHTTVADHDYEIYTIESDRIGVALPGGTYGSLKPELTSALEVANAAYAAMSPEQRALDLPTIARRADLWPDTVELMRTLNVPVEGEADRVYPKGGTLDLGTFDGTWVKARHPDFDSTPRLLPFDTDLVERVREALAAKARPAGHRVLRELHGKLFRVPTGKKTRVDPKKPPDYVALYFSAGWCGPCHSFSPDLVRFYEQNKKLAGKRFEVIWISRDRSERDMQDYAKEFGFPWLAVRWQDLDEIPITRTHNVGGIPVLVLLDANGAVVADSYVGGVYKGADSVLEVLAQRIAAGK